MNLETEVKFERKLYVGVGEAIVLAVSPNRESMNKLINYIPDEPQDEVEYVNGTTVKDIIDGEEHEQNVQQVKIDIWLKEKKTELLKPVSFYIKQKGRINKDGDKIQFINQVGETTWATDDEALQSADYEWFRVFIKKDYKTGEITDKFPKVYRQALIGEENVYSFLTSWLDFNRFNEKNDILLDNNRLFKGNFTELRELIDNYGTNSIVLAYSVKEKDYTDDNGAIETKQFQVLENRYFAPGKFMKQFRLFSSRPTGFDELANSTNKKLYNLRQFIKNITDGANGVKNLFQYTEIAEFEAKNFIAAGNEVSSDY